MGKASRDKGARGERELMNDLKERGVDCERNLSQTRDGGFDLNGLPHALEVKRCEKLQFAPWIKQTMEQADASGKQAALAWRQNNKPWTIAVFYTIDEFAELCKGHRHG